MFGLQAESGQSGKVAVANLGKIKTVVQIFALIFLLYNQPLFGFPIREAGLILLVMATVLTVWSMIQYLRSAFKA
jgi:CDP-diacylglycerol--glycerol-3-phosphate 3-phosphatidyltransferase